MTSQTMPSTENVDRNASNRYQALRAENGRCCNALSDNVSLVSAWHSRCLSQASCSSRSASVASVA